MLGPVSTWMGDCQGSTPSHERLSLSNQLLKSTQPGHPSVGRCNEYWRSSSGHHQGRNGEFCLTVGPVTRTADILAQSVNGAGC